MVPTLAGNGIPKIGIEWSGSPTQAMDHHRSCPIDAMMQITKNDRYEFYSFNLPLASEHKAILDEHNVVDLEEDSVSYAHTGALAQQMDMMISVCTSVIHLSGALNIPSIVLLSVHSDWRWLDDQTRSTWYPNTAIIRQPKDGDWDSVIQSASEYLDKFFN